MIELTISRSDVDRVTTEVLGGNTERCAVLFASRAIRPNGDPRLIVREVEIPSPESYSEQTASSAELKPAFVAKVSKIASKRGYSIIFVHSHPGDANPNFSHVDDLGERHLASFLATRAPDVPHAAIVISKQGWRARRLGATDRIRVISIGERREVLYDPSADGEPISRLFDRQVRAFGEAGQRAISSLTVAVVGLGGTGSVAVEQLAHLGVRQFILIDPDQVEFTNLNRLVGAGATDVGQLKVDVAAKHIAAIARISSIERLGGDITRTQVANRLISADFIFSCTDSHGSRAVIQQVAYQYLIPCIDIGSVITAVEGIVTGIHGRVQAIAPGLPCFTCSGLIDSEQVRRDMMNGEERRLDPYIQGEQEPAPSVISINSTVTSLAITMFMAMIVGIPSYGRYVLYDARGPSLRPVTATPNPTCYICSPSGVLGRGDSQVLFTRDG